MSTFVARTVVALASLLLFSTAAKADLILVLNAGGADVVTIDEELSGVLSSSGNWTTTVADGFPGAGTVMFAGSIGDFIVNVTTGISKPVVGPNRIHLDSINVSGGAGTLLLTLIDTDFTVNGAGSHPLIAEYAVLTDGTVSGFASHSPINSDTVFLAGPSFGPDTGPTFAGASAQAILLAAADPFSLVLQIEISHTGPLQSTSIDVQATVPEPFVTSLLLVGLAGMFVTRRRRR